MSRWVAGVLLAAALAVFAAFCVTIIDEREQGFRTAFNIAEPKLLGVTLNQPNLVEPGLYVVIPGKDLSRVVDQLGTIAAANDQLSQYHRERRRTLATE